MYTKAAIIEGMCLTYRHDFPLLTEDEKQGVKSIMGQIYQHNFMPFIRAIRHDMFCDCQNCRSALTRKLSLAIGN